MGNTSICKYDFFAIWTPSGNLNGKFPSANGKKKTSENLRAGKKNKFLTIDINDEKRFRKAGVQGPESGGWNYPDGLFVGKGGTARSIEIVPRGGYPL